MLPRIHRCTTVTCGACEPPHANPLGKFSRSRALAAWACWIIVASGPSSISMAVTLFCPAAIGPAEPSPFLRFHWMLRHNGLYWLFA
jgi:hypothetical protein